LTFKQVLLVLGLATACREPESHTGSAIAILPPTTSNGTVDITGVSRGALRLLGRLAPNDSTWTPLFAVYVDRGIPGSTSGVIATPPVIGRYSATDGRMQFTPRFPFGANVSYVVLVDTFALARLADGPSGGLTMAKPLVDRFSLATIAAPGTTQVVAVRPSASELPSNLLRWYVEFSAPMELGSALSHVHLLEESGREVTGAFLSVEQELWDPSRRRLTLLFDPGRVKRGVRTNDEEGAPIVAGRRYRVVIDSDWPDGAGVPLVSGYEHSFHAIPAERRAVDPAAWRLTPPQVGTRLPLTVAFGRVLDHALAGRLISVVDANGQPVPGDVALLGNDSVWQFRPATPWAAGEFAIRVSAILEDVAGNNLLHEFDVDRAKPKPADSTSSADSVRVVRFRVR
jgi:hypothetical protein